MELLCCTILCMQANNIKKEAQKLRAEGKTFQEINDFLGTKIPKSTFSAWFRGIAVPEEFAKKMEKERKTKLRKAQKKAVLNQRNKKKKYFHDLLLNNANLAEFLKKKETAKMVLATLYLCEGTKNKGRSSLVFGNSDPDIIKLFLRLLRQIFKVDEKKFRCTLQGRADQDIKKLEDFWSNITGIPRTQFYAARIDPRTKGKISKNPNYKGVCRIDYLSSEVFYEIMVSGAVLAGKTTQYRL